MRLKNLDVSKAFEMKPQKKKKEKVKLTEEQKVAMIKDLEELEKEVIDYYNNLALEYEDLILKDTKKIHEAFYRDIINVKDGNVSKLLSQYK